MRSDGNKTTKNARFANSTLQNGRFSVNLINIRGLYPYNCERKLKGHVIIVENTIFFVTLQSERRNQPFGHVSNAATFF
jgi:hypothetical protein